jgi:hypothetical protein
MAITTLAAVVNNGAVFTGVVKIRKGQALVLMRSAGGAGGRAAVAQTFRDAARAIAAAVPARHTAARALLGPAVAHIEDACAALAPPPSPPRETATAKSGAKPHALSGVQRATVMAIGLALVGAAAAFGVGERVAATWKGALSGALSGALLTLRA